MQTCPDCGCRVYSLGCVNCNEPAYIEEQIALTEMYETGNQATQEHAVELGAKRKTTNDQPATTISTESPS